jgi:hypothetical protein
VLDVAFAFIIGRQLVEPARNDILDMPPYQRLVGLGLNEIHYSNRAVDHAAATRFRRRRPLLQTVLMLDDPAFLVAKDVKADLGVGEIVIGVGEDVVTVLEHPDGIDPG